MFVQTIISDFQNISIGAHLKWFERPMVSMVTRRMMAESVSRFRKFPTTSSFSCCPREILREWCFLNTANGKFPKPLSFRKNIN